MPAPFIIFLAAILAVAVAIALLFWEKILEWAMDDLFPWFEKNMPRLEKYVREAFASLDKVIVPIKKRIKEAWEKLRQYLLKQIIELKRKSANLWVKKITSWIIVKLESGTPVVRKIETEEEIPYDSLPEDVRRDYISNKINQQDINVTETRDLEVAEITV